MFCIPYFWRSPKRSSLALQYQVSGCTWCAKNIWTYMKFEKQLAWWAALSYWPLSCTKVFGTTAHTAQISMHVLRTIFPGRLIFHFTDITWQINFISVVSIPLCYINYRSYILSNTTRWMLIHFNTYFYSGDMFRLCQVLESAASSASSTVHVGLMMAMTKPKHVAWIKVCIKGISIQRVVLDSI
jgi:hypothetical protein